MNFGKYLKLSWTSIMGHKLRSLLSLLGITVGIGAVIAIMTMMKGFEGSLVNIITQDLLRADTISISLEGSLGFGGDRVFSERDVAALRALPGVKSADVIGPLRGGTVYAGEKRLLDASVITTTSPDIIPLGVGELFQGPGQVVVGADVAKKVLRQLGIIEDLDAKEEERLRLSGQLPPVDYTQALGKQLRMRYLNRERKADEALLTVVGVVKDSQFLDGGDCYVDSGYYSDTEPIEGQEYLVFPGIFVRVNDLAQLAQVRDSVETYLTGETSDVYRLVGSQLRLDVQTTKEVVDEIQANFMGVAAFLGGIGAVALFVGMIGVMNIMLVSVKERTREIGIMKATGATNGFVMRAFLIECTMICLLGSILGIGLGLLGSRVISAALIAVSQGLEEIPFVFTPDWYAIAVVTGLVVGVASGLYPAWNAAKTDPIQALRYE